MIARYLKSMSNLFKNTSMKRVVFAFVAALMIGLAGLAVPASAQSTSLSAPQIPTSYTRVEASGSFQSLHITQFNGRGRFHATVVVDGVSFIGIGRYNAWNDAMSVKWYSYDSNGFPMMRGSFTGNLSSDYQVLTGAYGRLDEIGMVKMKAD